MPQAQPPRAGASSVQSLRFHTGAITRLAAPVIVTRAGVLFLIVIDMVMTGHAGAAELAYLGIGSAVQTVLMLVGLGMLRGTAILTAQAYGAGDVSRCGRTWRVALVHAAGLGILGGLLCVPGGPLLFAIGQDPAIAGGGGQVLLMYAWGMPGVLLFAASGFFLEGVSRPAAAMVIMLVANLINAGLNWVLIYGNLGAPALGAMGAVLATSTVRWLAAGALIAVIVLRTEHRRYGVRGSLRGAWSEGRTLRRLGYPVGFAQGLETLASQTLVVLAGYLGTLALAAFNVLNNVITLGILCSAGLAAATTVRVGVAVGGGDRHGTAIAGWTGFALLVVLMAGFAVPMMAVPKTISAVYTFDSAVQEVTAALLALAALALAVSGAQQVLLGALRGAGDVWVPAWIVITTNLFLMVPLATLFAFWLEGGVAGLLAGLSAGLAMAAAALAWRFSVISRRHIRPLVVASRGA